MNRSLKSFNENTDATSFDLKRRVNIKLLLSVKALSLMIWGYIIASGIISLHIWKGSINTEKYMQNNKYSYI